jgi:hypothetical protein
MTIVPNNKTPPFFDFKNVSFLPMALVVSNLLILVLVPFAIITMIVYSNSQLILVEKQCILLEKQSILLETLIKASRETVPQVKSSGGINLINLFLGVGTVVITTFLCVRYKNFIWPSRQGPSNGVGPSTDIDISSFPDVPSSPVLIASSSNNSITLSVHHIAASHPLPPTITDADLSAMDAHADLLERFLSLMQ